MNRFVRLVFPLLLLVVGWGLFYPFVAVTHADPIVISGEYNVFSAGTSPDDRYIVFLTESPARLISYDRETFESVILAYFPYNPTSISYTTTGDNQYVLFADDLNGPYVQLYHVPIDGSLPPTRTVTIETDPGGFTYNITPDGQTVVYLDGSGDNVDIKAIPVTGGTPTLLNEGIDNGAVFDFQISPSGGYVTYVVEDANSTPTRRALVPITGGTPRIVNPANSEVDYYDASFVESVDALFFTANINGEGSRLYRVPLSGGNATVITPPEQLIGDFQLGKAQEFIIYSDYDGDGYTLRRLTVSDNTIIPVSPLPGPGFSYFSLAPEGARAFIYSFLYVSPTLTTTVSTASFDPPTTAVPLVTISNEDQSQAIISDNITSDGSWYVYKTGDSNVRNPLFSMRGDGSENPITLYNEPQVSTFTIGPNQQEVFFQTHTATGAAYQKVPIDGGTPTLLFESAGEATFIQTVGFLSNGDLLLIDRNGTDDPRLDSLYLLEGVVSPVPTTVETYLPLIRYDAAPPPE
jgi:hypothetical protein